MRPKKKFPQVKNPKNHSCAFKSKNHIHSKKNNLIFFFCILDFYVNHHPASGRSRADVPFTLPCVGIFHKE